MFDPPLYFDAFLAFDFLAENGENKNFLEKPFNNINGPVGETDFPKNRDDKRMIDAVEGFFSVEEQNSVCGFLIQCFVEVVVEIYDKVSTRSAPNKPLLSTMEELF